MYKSNVCSVLNLFTSNYAEVDKHNKFMLEKQALVFSGVKDKTTNLPQVRLPDKHLKLLGYEQSLKLMLVSRSC